MADHGGAGAGTEDRTFRELCRLYGVQPLYRGADGRWREGERWAALEALRRLGAPLEDMAGVDDALRHRRLEVWERGLPPSVVAWDGRLRALRLRRPARAAGEAVTVHAELEGGRARELAADVRPTRDRRRVEGRDFSVDVVRVPRDLPPGRHRLRIGGPGGSVETWVISAPSTACPDPAGEGAPRRWGVFLPLYAFGSGEDGWGVGSYTDLRRLGRWSRSLGGSLVGTLPLLPTFLDAPFDPSPYAPVSRLFWSELYVDLERSPHLDGCPEARELLSRSDVRSRRDEFRGSGRVAYREIARLKLEVLEALAACADGGDGSPPRSGPGGGDDGDGSRTPPGDVGEYAAFRAACHRRGAAWRDWDPARSHGELRAGRDFDPAVRDAHAYAQWLAELQLDDVARDGRRRGYALYLDLPLSARADGYDVWRRPGLFADGVSVGSPPDPFFSEGQDWGFPPVLPGEMRRRGFDYTRACLRHHMRHAGAIRVDHVMGFHRLFWVPAGGVARDGVYVRYPWRELHALTNLESRRAGVAVVGEDLGTVPDSVRRAMDRHGLKRTYVMPFELTGDSDRPLREPPREAMISLDTHDMWPFAGWWRGADIDDREESGELDPEEAESERRGRERQRNVLREHLVARGHVDDGADLSEILGATLALLGESVAWCVLVNVEDLWLETRPQNVPGSRGADRSWRRRARLGFETFSRSSGIRDVLRRLDGSRGPS